jgi:Txe/YoeB family toxin of Txe-Axe toxin-antitoxin module
MKENVRSLVLNIVSDDYEDLNQIEKMVHRYLSRSGIHVSRKDIEDALLYLVENGNVSAFLLSQWEPHSVQVEVTSKPMSDLWFYATERGRAEASVIDEIIEKWSRL